MEDLERDDFSHQHSDFSHQHSDSGAPVDVGGQQPGGGSSSVAGAAENSNNPVRRIAAITAAVVVAGLVAVGGAVLDVRSPTPPAPAEITGSTLRACPVLPRGDGSTEVMALSTSTWGTLKSRALGSEEASDIEVGKGARILAPPAPILLQAEGRQTQSSAGASFARASGAERGISLARCDHPSTTSWFSGVMTSGDQRAELVLTNTDTAQAQVDLKVFGRQGVVAAPGSRGLTVPGGTTRTVALDSMVNSPDPVGVEVGTTRGRINAVVRHRTFDGVTASGSDWQTSSVEPATSQVIPGIPSGQGERTLAVTNPGSRRTTVKVEALGASGTFAPADAAEIEVNGESTAGLRLDQALAGEAVALRLTADQPIFAAARSRGEDGARSDVAIESADRPLAGASVAALAVVPGGNAELVLSSTDDRDLTVDVMLVAANGEELKRAQLPVRSGASSVWKIDSVDEPAGVKVMAPRQSGIHAGVVIRTDADGYQGLTGSGLSVPELASAGVDPRFDPTVG